jgi:putative serine protease PepD
MARVNDNEPAGSDDRGQDTAPLWSPAGREHAGEQGGPQPTDGSAEQMPDDAVPGQRPAVDGAGDHDWPAPQSWQQDPQQQQSWEGPQQSWEGPQDSQQSWQDPQQAWHDPYGYYGQTQPMPYQGGWYAEPQQRAPRLPGWVWPLVAATALVVGVLGGTLGGALVSSTIGEVTAGPTVFEGEGEGTAPAPLDADNGSVAAVAESLLPSTVQILTRGGEGPGGSATGSGFVVDREGHVITNNHVVEGVASSGRIRVVDHAGRSHEAEIVGRSPVYDIAVLDIDGAVDLQPAALGSSTSMHVGETVVAIGSPLGLSSTVTSGIVSALDRPVTTGDADESSFINAVQTDAAINPGNSGGPLVNLRGEVVGVNSAIASMGGFGAKPGNIGVGFAIPMEQVKVTANQILRTGEAVYPVIGANVDTGTQRNGAEIVEVPAGTPADDAGLEEGDIVVAVDDRPVSNGIGLIVAIRSHRPGETISLRVRRDGREETVRVTLDAKVG